MVDGIASVDILGAMLRLEPRRKLPTKMGWHPRPLPSDARLLAGELARRAKVFELLREAGDWLRAPRRALALHDLGAASGATLGVASATPFNVAVGPRRSFAWTRLDLDAVKMIKGRLGGTVNAVRLMTLC